MIKILITDKQAFDEAVWQTQTDFQEQEYQQWVKETTQTLDAAKDYIEEQEDVDVDTYRIGDVSNLLSVAEVVNADKPTSDEMDEVDEGSFREILSKYDLERVINVMMADIEHQAWDYGVEDTFIEQERMGNQLRAMIRKRLAELI